MKYYYKSPEELREKIESRKKTAVSPYRNRTFLTIFTDIILFLAVFSVLYYGGILYSVRNLESDEKIYKKVKISAVIAEPRGKNEPDLLHYLRVRNISDQSILFPDEASGYDCRHVTFTVKHNGNTVMKSDILPEKRRIAPGSAEIYRYTPAAPELAGYSKSELSFEYALHCGDQLIILSIR